GSGAALFQGCIVQKGIWISVEDLVAKWGGLARVAGDEFNLPAADVGQYIDPAIDIHSLVQAVFESLLDVGMVGDFGITVMIFQTACLGRKDSGQQIVAAEALQIRRYALPVLISQHS